MNPPRLATWLLSWCGPANDPLLGDLLEEYRSGRSGRWYWRQVMIAMLMGRWTYLPRLLISGCALVLGVLVAAMFIEPVTDVILRALSLEGSVIYADPGAAAGLAARITIAALAGLILATPVVFYQLGLAATGSTAGRWLAVRFAVVATGCFVGGVLLSHFVLFPSAWRFFVRFIPDGTEVVPRLQPAFSFYAGLLLTCGLVFQMPAMAFFLARVGVVTPACLVRNRGYAVALMFTFAAVVTPTGDPVTLTLTAVPLVAFYGLSVVLARRGRRFAQPT